MKKNDPKTINSWCMYDWANSVYNLVITSTIFPAYFEVIAKNRIDEKGIVHVIFLGGEFVNTALYTYALAFAFLIVAIISPILSSIADYKGNKKSFLQFFLTVGSLSCALLFFFKSKDDLAFGIFTMIFACIGFWSSFVFYNSYLPEIATPDQRDRVSARGFVFGYIGSVILQIICFVFVFFPEILGGDKHSTIQFRASFLLVGIWWWGFGQIALRNLPKSEPAVQNNKFNVFIGGYKELQKVWNQLTHIPVLKRYLSAFFFYNMGVQTVMLAATLYGKSELKIPTTNLIVAILMIQLVAIPGAYLMAKLSGKYGNINTLMVVVVTWVFLCIAGYMIPVGGIFQFYTLAICVGFVMGGIQSLSRSTYSKLMPETHDTTSFFSFYDVTEKIAIVIGMFSFGVIQEITGSQRNSVLALVVFFLLGFVGLFFTRKAQALQA